MNEKFKGFYGQKQIDTKVKTFEENGYVDIYNMQDEVGKAFYEDVIAVLHGRGYDRKTDYDYKNGLGMLVARITKL